MVLMEFIGVSFDKFITVEWNNENWTADKSSYTCCVNRNEWSDNETSFK